jgi:two-component system nitrogen regulation response regulator GlnG
VSAEAIRRVETDPQAERTPGGDGVAADVPSLVGRSQVFRSAVGLAVRVAAYPATSVLLAGETGTGKELFARAIHGASPNAGEPFVAINCAAIPETLLESELFGHEKGAFTDARTPKRGLLEVAGRGTVMLDEVNELPLGLQPKLLRVLEERKVRRLGGVEEYAVGCRIIAASNRDLAALVESGSFRGDLFYRLNVVRIDLPPLRERADDLEQLADHFITRICKEHGLTRKRVSAQALAVLASHPWLGNVRELKNTLESAIVMCDGDTIRPEHIRLRKRTSVQVAGDVILSGQNGNGGGAENGAHGHTDPSAAQADPSAPPTVLADGSSLQPSDVLRLPQKGLTLEDMERLLIAETLRRARGNRSLTARMLGISRPTVIRKLERYGLR